MSWLLFSFLLQMMIITITIITYNSIKSWIQCGAYQWIQSVRTGREIVREISTSIRTFHLVTLTSLFFCCSSTFHYNVIQSSSFSLTNLNLCYNHIHFATLLSLPFSCFQVVLFWSFQYSVTFLFHFVKFDSRFICIIQFILFLFHKFLKEYIACLNYDY